MEEWTKYKVVSEPTIEQLNKTMNHEIGKNGWKPQGGIYRAKIQGREEFIQAVVKNV